MTNQQQAMGGPLFSRVGPDTVQPTDYCRGPWSLHTLHGGPVVGLLAWVCEQQMLETASQAASDAAFHCSRLTVEMLRAVPLAELQISALTVKPGRRSVVIDAEIRFGGEVVARATSQWLAYDPAAVVEPGWVPPMPPSADDPRSHAEFEYPQPGFNADTAELRYVSGSHEEAGPGTTWLRLLSPLIDGEARSSFVSAALISDLAAAAGWEPSPSGTNYINPDVTLQLHRRPQGDWLALAAKAEHTGNGVGLMTATVYDHLGSVGRVLQSLLETPMQLDAQSNS